MSEIVIYVKPSCGCEGFEINIKELIETFEGLKAICKNCNKEVSVE